MIILFILLSDKLGEEVPQVLDENDGWVDVQEDEEEAKWVKLRQERDKFLEERMVRIYCMNNIYIQGICLHTSFIHFFTEKYE